MTNTLAHEAMLHENGFYARGSYTSEPLIKVKWPKVRARVLVIQLYKKMRMPDFCDVPTAELKEHGIVFENYYMRVLLNLVKLINTGMVLG